MDEVRLWRTARSQAQILAHMRDGSGLENHPVSHRGGDLQAADSHAEEAQRARLPPPPTLTPCLMHPTRTPHVLWPS